MKKNVTVVLAALTSLLAHCPVAVGADMAGPDPATGLQSGVMFSGMTALSQNAELAQRLWSPLEAAQMQRELARAGKVLGEQPVTLSEEHFTVYVPPARPANGYGLLVYIPASDNSRLPSGWASVLDKYGVIFISADRSGNAENVYDRRIPLALNAAASILARYAVDAKRVYVGGTSGGSRVAMRAALAYPDLFHGAMLNAGSDEIGNDFIPLPPKDLLYRFQESTALVYMTGDADSVNLNKDSASRGAMRNWCQFNLDSETMFRTGHSVANAGALSRVLELLAAPPVPDGKKLDACRADIEKDLDAQMAQAQALQAAGKWEDAKTLLEKIDRRFGGLAAPRSLALDDALAGPIK